MEFSAIGTTVFIVVKRCDPKLHQIQKILGTRRNMMFCRGKMFYHVISLILNPIGGVMVSVLASSAVDPGIESRSGQTKDYKIGICCFSAKHESLRRKSKDWLARNQNNVSEWSDMSTCRLLFQ
jgi:hypothetical protein